MVKKSEISKVMRSLAKRRWRKVNEQERSETLRNVVQARWRQKMENLNRHLLDRLHAIRGEPIGTVCVSGFPPHKVTRAEMAGQLVNFKAGDELLDIGGVAARLALPKGTVYELCRSRGRIKGNALPHFKVGRRLKFNWTAVVAWLDGLEKRGVQ